MSGENLLQAIRQIVARTDIASVRIPEEFGEQVEVIILPAASKSTLSAESQTLLRVQEQTGFVANVLADEQEDVWNEL